MRRNSPSGLSMAGESQNRRGGLKQERVDGGCDGRPCEVVVG